MADLTSRLGIMLATATTIGLSNLLWTLAFLMASPLLAGETNLSTELSLTHSYATRLKVSQKQSLSVLSKLDTELADDLSLHGSLRFSHDRQDTNDYTREGSYDRFSQPYYIGSKSKLGLLEWYVDWQVGNGLLRLGKQQVAWGETDGLRVLDLVNPLDLSEFVLAPFDEIRIPVWMLNYSWIGETYTYQLLFIPDTTRSYIPNGYFQPTSPLVVPVLSGEAEAWTLHPDPGGRSGLKHADIGLRLGRSVSGKDISLILLRQQNHEYLLVASQNPPDQTRQLWPTYFMRHLIGLSYSESLDVFVFRAEFSYSPKEYFYQHSLGSGSGVSRSAEFRYAAALDWYGMDDAVVTLQLLQSGLFNSAAELVRDRVDTTLSFSFSQDLMNQIYRLDLALIHNLDRGDGLLRAAWLWNTTDHLSLSVGLDSFYGRSDGLFGQFDENDRINLVLKYTL